MDFFIEFISEVFIGLVVLLFGTALVAIAHLIRTNWKEETQTDEFIEEVGERLIDNGEHIIFKEKDSSVIIPKKTPKPKLATKPKKAKK